MELTKELDYGVRVVIFLGRKAEDVDVGEVAEQNATSVGNLSKLLSPLIRAGIILPTGKNRIALAKDPSEITLADVISAYGQPLELKRCLLRHGDLHPCRSGEVCGTCLLWSELQGDILETMANYTIADFARLNDATEEHKRKASREHEDDED